MNDVKCVNAAVWQFAQSRHAKVNVYPVGHG